jgi:hypothetical protein
MCVLKGRAQCLCALADDDEIRRGSTKLDEARRGPAHSYITYWVGLHGLAALGWLGWLGWLG